MLADRIQMEPSPVVNISLPTTIANSKFKTSHVRRGNQKSLRRRETLLKKIFEYCTECDADIHFVLRMKKTGQLYTLTSNAKEWPLSTEQINKESNHPEPIQMKMDELAIKYQGQSPQGEHRPGSLLKD
ncbi:unnamed protein product [Penicillium salamii]|nr:unnamed protein product [Penicillium salamii]CAG8158268.1 unnamed protein product [Penicillium salamii]